MNRGTQILIAAATTVILAVAAVFLSGEAGRSIPAAAQQAAEDAKNGVADAVEDMKDAFTDEEDKDYFYYNTLAYLKNKEDPDAWTHPNWFSGPDAEGRNVYEQAEALAAEDDISIEEAVAKIFMLRLNPEGKVYDPALLAFICALTEEQEGADIILTSENKGIDLSLKTDKERRKAMEKRVNDAHKHFRRDHAYAEACYARLMKQLILDEASIEELEGYESSSYQVYNGLGRGKPSVTVERTNGYGGHRFNIPLVCGGKISLRVECGFQGIDVHFWWPVDSDNPPVPENPPHEDPPPEEDYGKDPDGGTMTEKGNDPRFGGGANKDEHTDKEVTSETESPDKPYVAPAAPEANGDGGGSDSSTDDPKWGERVDKKSESGSNAVDKGKSDPEVTVGNDTNKGGDFANRADQIHDEPEKPVVNNSGGGSDSNSGGGSDSNSGSNSNTDTSQTQEPGQSQPATVTSEPSAPGGEFGPIE